MNLFARLWKPLHQAGRAFFSHDVAIRRDADGVRLVLEEALPEGVPRPPTAKELARRKERAELDLVLDQLRDVLDGATGARTALHHLVFVEHALSKKGLRTLHKLPLPVLQRALDQLEHLVTNWSAEGLANLRSKMAVAVIDREHMDSDAEADAYRTAAVLDLPMPTADAAAATLSKLSKASTQVAAATDSANAKVVDIPIDALRPAACIATPQEEADALAAAYAALAIASTIDPVGLEPLEYQEELGSPAAKVKARAASRDTGALPEIQLRELQS